MLKKFARYRHATSRESVFREQQRRQPERKEIALSFIINFIRLPILFPVYLPPFHPGIFTNKCREKQGENNTFYSWS